MIRDVSKRINYAAPENMDYSDGIDRRFPINIIRGVAGDFADIYGDKLESPPQFFYATFMAFLGAKCSGRVVLDSILAIQPRLFIALIGESADSRKSTALKMCKPYFSEIATHKKVGSGEGLTRVLSESSVVMLYYDELLTMIKKTKQESSTLLGMMTELFSENTAENQLASAEKSMYVDNAYLSMVAGCTTKTYQKLFEEEALDIGFVNRLFIVPGESDKRIADPINVSSREHAIINEGLLRIDGMIKNGLAITKSNNAFDAYRQWYESVQRTECSKRIDEYCQRWAILMAINKHEMEINKDTMLDAIDLAEWQLKVRELYAPYEAKNGVGAIEEQIERQLKIKGRLSHRDLFNFTNARRHGGRKAFEWALKNLIESDVVQTIDVKKKRPEYVHTDSLPLVCSHF